MYSCLFAPPLWAFRGIFAWHDVTHRLDRQKNRPWAETCRLSHSAQKVQRFDLGA